MDILTRFFAFFVRSLLRLRYRINWKGFDDLEAGSKVLFLPNHPAEIDPVILASKLWPKFEPRPLAVEDFYYMPGVHALMKAMRALPVPNMIGAASEYKRRRLQHTIDSAKEALKSGDNVMLYPAGRLMRDKVENLGANSAVYDILQEVPDVKICVVRTRGLLGSSFAWYTQKQRPDLGKALKNGAKWILANLILFTPRRPLTIEARMVSDDFPRKGDKLEINRWLENWYNEEGPEEISLVSYSLWSKVVPEVVEFEDEENQADDDVDIPEETMDKVRAGLAEISGMNTADIKPNVNLSNDLGFDSLNMADLVAWMEEEFFVTDVDPSDLRSVHDVAAATVGKVKGEKQPPARTPENWIDSGPRPALQKADPDGNIPYAFMKSCERLGKLPAVGDDNVILTYSRMKMAVLVLAEVFKEYPEERIGIMLPSTVAADLAIMATLTVGKVPVMINWTLGDSNLSHVLEISEIKRIITSTRFLDNLEAMNFDLIEDYIVTLEDLKLETISLGHKVKAFINHFKNAESLGRIYGYSRFSPDDLTVILFTSGSESVPKGVPLSHRNIISNFNSAMEHVKLRRSDCIYGFLPPFHSFGFTITCMMPLLNGIKVAYYPNPTESRKLARGIETWKPTCIASTPTFFSGILKAARKEQLSSLRMVVSGAEKAPQELFKKAEEVGISLLEGYGITETSPALTITPPDEPRVGVGTPVGDVELLIVDPDTYKPLPQGERGLILARGSNVFSGYLQRDSSDSFQEVDGKTYYVTGDLGYLNEKKHLTISGRLKRFVKIGGEMISLPAMEDAIADKWPSEDEPNAAIVPHEQEGERPELYLFNTFGAELSDVNATLKEAGFTNLARVTDVIEIEDIPQLGTGKTDYQTLKRMLNDKLEDKDG